MLSLARNALLFILLAGAIIIMLVRPGEADFTTVTKKIQREIDNAEEHFYESDFSTTEETPYYLYHFIRDSLVFWSSHEALPSHNLLEDGTSFQKLKNGWYVCFRRSDPKTQSVWVGTLPVKYTYPVQNKFLQNNFAFRFRVPENIELTDQKIPGSTVIADRNNRPLFYMYVSGAQQTQYINWRLLIAQIIFWLVIIYLLYLGVHKITASHGVVAGWLTLLIGFIAIRAVMLWFNLPGELKKLPLFDPQYYASSVITPSLGDLLINCLMFFAVNRYLTLRAGTQVSLPRPVLLLICCGAVLILTGIILSVFKTLVIDSVISFEVYNVLSLDGYSLLGLLCIAILTLTHFQLSVYLFRLLIANGIDKRTIFRSILLMVFVFLVWAFTLEIWISAVFTAIWLGVFSGLMYRYVSSQRALALRHVVIFVAAYSLVCTFLIENLYEKKERQHRRRFADKLVVERDYVAEYLFRDVSQNIAKDVLARNYFSNPFISRRELADRINSLYFSGYYNKYDIEYRMYDPKGHALRNVDSLSLTDLSRSLDLLQWQSDTLYYINDTTQNYRYFSIISCYQDSILKGYVAVTLYPKAYYGQNVYPELLLGSNVVTNENQFNYSYAIYQGDKLIAQYGEYPYTYYWNPKYNFGTKEHVFIEEWKWEHGIARYPNGKRVIVSVEREPFFEPIATFSYMFSFLFIMVLLSLLIKRLLTNRHTDVELLDDFKLSFRTRINYSMLFMIVVSFIVIGLTTIRFFAQQYENFYSDRLNRKEKVIHASLEYYIQQNIITPHNLHSAEGNNTLSYEVARLADINDIDINLFDTQGRLVVSSQPSIYDKGIVSKLMHPVAYQHLKTKGTPQYTQQEQIGKLRYLATYSPVRSTHGETIAYLGIPYFERTRDINEEVSSFLIALMNVYVFLLLCAAATAYFISNSITRPLTIISEKLRILNLNKRNEPIEWNSKDEIGVLVGEYNKMINELEQSAQKLAKSERESAWREMAKQIAHEIKNPLTPMKLSIQYLQRAIDEGAPNIDQLAKRVTKTLDEQIENLSSIATAFSSFAKMPKAENEIINLNELLKSVVELFGNEQRVQMSFETNTVAANVFADKNQLLSVFNNLVKNGIQSIPEGRNGYIDVKVTEESGWITVSVKDNGCGIKPENYDRVFVPNFTTKSSGTGLGLAIVKQIIDGAGGSIWFESEVDKGTTFFVRLKKVGD